MLSRSDGGTPGPHRLSTLAVVWMVTVSVIHFPLRVYIVNSAAVRDPLLHIALWASVVGLVLAVVALLLRRGTDRALTTYGAMVASVVFTSGNVMLYRHGALLGSLFWILVVVAAGFTIWRLRNLVALHALMFLVAVFLTLSPLVPFLTDGGDGQAPLTGTDIAYSGNGYLPDIVLVVLDGYPGVQFLEGLEGWDGAVVGELSDRGVSVRPAWSSYSMTHLSLPSLFDVSYRVEPVEGVNPVSPLSLRPLVGGDGAVHRFLEQAGYHFTMVEPAWDGSQCGARVDRCVRAPFLDQVAYYALERTLVGPLLDRKVGSPWHHAASRTARWYEANLEALAVNQRPDFVFAHVILPHPPFLLTEDCEMDYRREFDAAFVGFIAAAPGLVDAQLGQMACIDRHLARVAELVGPETLLIFVSDHGSELRSQVSRDPRTWTDADIAERMSTFFAIRGPEACHPTGPVMVPNIFRAVMRCMGTEIPDLPPRMMLVSVTENENGVPYLVEVEEDALKSLISGSAPGS